MTREQIDKRLDELYSKRRQLEIQRAQLEGTHVVETERNEHQQFTGDAWAVPETKRVQNASEAERQRVRDELNKVTDEIRKLNEARINAKSNDDVEQERKEQARKEAEEIAQKRAAEKEQEKIMQRVEMHDKKRYFETIKKINKKKLKNTDLVSRISSSKPKWSKLKNYTKEELEFIINMGREETKRDFTDSEFRSAFSKETSVQRSMRQEEMERDPFGYGRSL